MIDLRFLCPTALLAETSLAGTGLETEVGLGLRCCGNGSPSWGTYGAPKAGVCCKRVYCSLDRCRCCPPYRRRSKLRNRFVPHYSLVFETSSPFHKLIPFVKTG